MSTPGTGSGQPPESGPEAGRQPVRIPRRDTDVGRVIDAPTEGVERDELPKNLPDLDKIHQVAPASAPTVPVPAQPAAEAPAPAPSAPAAEEAAPSNLHTVGGAPARAAGVKTQAANGPVRAGMQLRSIDPWTTFKLTGVVSVVLFFVWMIAVGVLYIVLSGMGVWSKINDSFQTLTNEQAGVSLLTAGNVFTYAGLAGLANVILLTALATVGAFIYNLCADLVGGIEVTLADRD